eukprot:TRINITY_DN24339_c0_g1_i1.p1 TRINITY_DN24339_c0_g1~~TRINITY_DN24339_c0_g1_i1.p1  ORF type:complete len:366 (+),score=81.86 TRINITY_DN24339_c0_g1_i1:98-1195(+)
MVQQTDAMARTSAGSVVSSLETGGLKFHDNQLDYYGKRVAAAASDNTVYVWDITDNQQKPAGQVKGHEGPVWKVAWAHPKFGSLFATCGFDMKAIVWKEVPANSGNWQAAHVDSSHTASVNDIQFCPFEHGLRLACASSDGTVSVLSYGMDHQWRRTSFQAHLGGAQTVSWAPGGAGTSMRLVTGGCDHSVSVWRTADGEAWTQEMPPLPPVHNDWVRSVAWRPEGAHGSVIASGSWDKTVVVWAQETEGQPWRQICKLDCADKVEGVAWSVTGSLLAISYGSGSATVYREAYNGGYEEIGKIAEQGFTEVAPSAPIGGGHGFGVNDASAAGPPGAQGAPGAPPVASLSAELATQQQAVLDSFGM